MPSNLLLQTLRVNDVAEKVRECYVQVLPVFSTRLVVRDVIVLGELAGTILINFYIIDQVDFVAKHDDLRVGIGVFSNFLEPVAHVFETICVCHVVHENYARGPLIIRVS